MDAWPIFFARSLCFRYKLYASSGKVSLPAPGRYKSYKLEYLIGSSTSLPDHRNWWGTSSFLAGSASASIVTADYFPR